MGSAWRARWSALSLEFAQGPGVKLRRLRQPPRGRVPSHRNPGSLTQQYFPSGRLCLEVSDRSRHSWQNEHLIGRCYDRKTKPLEAYLGAVVIALSPAAALIKHRRAEERSRHESAPSRKSDDGAKKHADNETRSGTNSCSRRRTPTRSTCRSSNLAISSKRRSAQIATSPPIGLHRF